MKNLIQENTLFKMKHFIPVKLLCVLLVMIGFLFMASADSFVLTVVGAFFMLLPAACFLDSESTNLFSFVWDTDANNTKISAVKKEDVIDKMYSMARKLSKEFSASEKEKQETQEPIVYFIKDQYKDFRPETTWSNDDVRIEFRYRFAHPCVCIRISDGSFAEVEVRDTGEGTADIVNGIYSKRTGRSLLEHLQSLWEGEK